MKTSDFSRILLTFAALASLSAAPTRAHACGPYLSDSELADRSARHVLTTYLTALRTHDRQTAGTLFATTASISQGDYRGCCQPISWPARSWLERWPRARPTSVTLLSPLTLQPNHQWVAQVRVARGAVVQIESLYIHVDPRSGAATIEQILTHNPRSAA
ncbi:MAG: hypothetical protein Q8Q09_04920 [Deltaproteobacteria bacterium]|nr:hypothetical protein [Deltaproteobacteria bacterium]